MPVKIFVPKIPSNEDEFTSYIKKICNPANMRISKNKDGSSYCIILVNYTESIKCANDVIREVSGKVFGDIMLKPRIYVDQTLLCKLSSYSICGGKEMHDDIVNTTHFANGYYFVQLLSEKDTNVILTSLLRDLYDDYKSGMVQPLPHDGIVVGRLYASFYNDEKQFYRIRVLEKQNSEIKVAFVDYGNEEIISYDNIVAITDKLSHISPMVHKCIISALKIINQKREEVAAREVLHRNYRAKLVRRWDDTLQSDRVISLDYLDFTSISYRNYLIIEDIAEEISHNGDQRSGNNCGRVLPNVTTGSIADNRNGFKEEQAIVMITHFESLDEFYVQQANKTTDDTLAKMTSTIEQLVIEIDDQLQYVGQDHIYLSKFSQDGNWYRCRVMDDRFHSTSSPHCVVQYIDFGNTELKYDKRDLKPLADKYWAANADLLAAIPPCAKKCRFSDDLVYALSKAKMEKDYFQQNFVNGEKIVTFMYYFDKLNKVWIVDNIILTDNEDIMSLVLQKCESSDRKTDIYRLHNLEYLDKIWFSLVKSIDPIVQTQLTTVEKWSREQNVKELEPVKFLLPSTIYCAKLSHSVPGGANLVRCCVIGRNKHNAMIQAIDSGIYDSVSIGSLFHLPESLKAIAPLARPFRLVFSVVCAEEHQIEEKIVQIVGNHSVELDMVNESCIRDVIIKEKSLVQCLAQLDYILPSAGLRVSTTLASATGPTSAASGNEHGEFRDLPECLLPVAGDDNESNSVDFSLPSVEKMDEVPKDIAVCNGKVRFMRKLFSVVEKENLFDQLAAVVANCGKLDNFVVCCQAVEELSTSLETLNGDFINLSSIMKTKLRDFDPLIEKRTHLCETICTQHTSLKQLLLETPFDNLETLSVDIGMMVNCVDNLVDIFQLPQAPEDQRDITATQQQVVEFRGSELFQSVYVELEQQAASTEDVVGKYRLLMEAMCCDYGLGDPLPTAGSAAIPLIDRTYELHGALKSECTRYCQQLLTRDDVMKQFDLAQVVWNYRRYLQQQRTTVEMIMVKADQLETLNAYAEAILADNSALCQQIEENHRRIIAYRLALKHGIADMEDAEEQDEKEKIDEISAKISGVRRSLHQALNASMNIIEPDVRKLMLRQPELQFKNQSIFFCVEGIPVFLWDSIFFDIPPTDQSTDFFSTRFADNEVSMRKLSLGADTYWAVLHNLTTYSSRTNSSSSSSLLSCTNTSSSVSPIPLSCVFLSKTETATIYVILPALDGIDRLPDIFVRDLPEIVAFFKATINQILNLWHLGFTFNESDLDNGLFVMAPSSSQPDRVFLPLPLSSILHRENICHAKCGSIQIYLSKLGDLLQQSLSGCNEFPHMNEDDVRALVDDIKNCKGVQEAEQIFQALDQFLMNNPRRDGDLDDGNNESTVETAETVAVVDEEYVDHNSSNDNGSSIEQLPHEGEDEDEVGVVVEEEEVDLDDSGSVQEKELSVTEQILEIYSDVE